MIRVITRPTAEERRRARWRAKRHWRACFVPIAICNVEGFGRVLVTCEWLETRWSDRQARRLWRRPE